MKVEIRPIPVKRWHGKTGSESFTQPKQVEALYDPETGKYATGLTPEEAQQYGGLMGVDLSDTFRAEGHPYWGNKEAWVILPNHTLILETNRAQDFVRWKLMKASKFVANSQKELDAGKWPFASHVIFDEEEEVELKATRVQLKRKANTILAKVSAEGKANCGHCRACWEDTVKNVTYPLH